MLINMTDNEAAWKNFGSSSVEKLRGNYLWQIPNGALNSMYSVDILVKILADADQSKIAACSKLWGQD